MSEEFEDLEREWEELNRTEDPMVAFTNKKEEVQRDIQRLNDYCVNMHKKNGGYVNTRKLLEQVIKESRKVSLFTLSFEFGRLELTSE